MRPVAIELVFDRASDDRLCEMWSRLSELYTRQSRAELGIRPHVTLALFRGVEPDALLVAAESLASQLQAFCLELATVDRFPGLFSTASAARTSS